MFLWLNTTKQHTWPSLSLMCSDNPSVFLILLVTASTSGTAVLLSLFNVGVAQEVEQHLDLNSVGLVRWMVILIAVPPSTWAMVKVFVLIEIGKSHYNGIGIITMVMFQWEKTRYYEKSILGGYFCRFCPQRVPISKVRGIPGNWPGWMAPSNPTATSQCP